MKAKKQPKHDPIYDLPKWFRREIIKTYGSLRPTKKKVLDIWEEIVKENKIRKT